MALDAGDTAPDFAAESHDGTPLRLADFRGERVVVLYFYPKDATPGCTVEARKFRDLYDDFVGAGAVVIGVSHDSQASHRSFASNHRLPFALVSDPDGDLRDSYDVPRTLGVMPGRTTYVIDKQGVVRMKFTSQVRALAHATKALAMVRQLATA